MHSVASLIISIPFHRVSIPIFCGAFFFFNLLLISAPFLWALRVSRLFGMQLTWVFLHVAFDLLLRLISDPHGLCPRVYFPRLPVFAHLFHRRFIFACSIFVDFSLSQKPCLPDCNIRDRVFFSSPVPTVNTFSTSSPRIWRLPLHFLSLLRSSSTSSFG